MSRKYKIIVCAYNSMQWLAGTLNSIDVQTYRNFDPIVVDDASTDPSQAPFIKAYCEARGWRYVLNPQNMGAMHNQVHAIRQVDEGNPTDVIVFLDGDDRLAHAGVLDRLNFYYDQGYKMTYGQYRSEPFSPTCTLAYAYPPDVIATNDYRLCAARHGGIRFNHLRTISYELFYGLNDTDFQDMHGNWFRSCTDAAIMIPSLELSRGNYKFIQEVLYIYNSENPISDWRRHPSQVDSDHDWILFHLQKKV